jgi:hypothetical protein
VRATRGQRDAEQAHLLPGPFTKGNTLLHGGRHSAGQLRFVLPKRIIACGHGVVDTSLQIPWVAQLADDPSTDLVDDPGNLRIAGGARP